MPKVAVVTDSTACLPAPVVEDRGIEVVPLQVVIGARSFADGVDPEASPANVARALKEFVPVSTSRPSPAVLLDTYEAAAAGGAEEVVSIHLSAELSATYDSAVLAAKEASVPVHVLDSRLIGMGVGYAALAAADVRDRGGSAAEMAAAAARCAGRTFATFYVDTLEYLRRGGRIGSAAALVGSALAVKPLLRMLEGRITTLEKVRTTARALGRLEELAVEAAAADSVQVTVSHLANEQRARQLAAHLADRLAENLGGREVEVGEVGAVIGAHVGPGLVGVVVAPAPPLAG